MNKNYTSPTSLRCLTLLLLVGTSLLAGCEGRKASNESAGSGQRGSSVTRFDEVEKILPVGSGDYAWLLTTGDNHQLLPGSIYLTSEYGEILNKEKPILSGEHVDNLWGVEGKAYRVWAKSKDSIFFIDTPQRGEESQAPLVQGTIVKKVFAKSSDESIRDLRTVPNTRSAWLVTSRGSYDSGLYFLDADSPTPAKEVELPQKFGIKEISMSRGGNSVWLVWTKQLDRSNWPNYQDGAIFVENKEGVFSFSKPILGDTRVGYINPLVPAKEGRLAWQIGTTLISVSIYSGEDPVLVSSNGTVWPVKEVLFGGAEVHYDSSAASDVSRLWVTIKGKPGIYLVAATDDGPKIEKQLLDNVLTDRVYPRGDNMAAWVFADDGRRIYYITSDGLAHEMEVNLGQRVEPIMLASSPDGKKAWLVAADDSPEPKQFHLFFINRDSNEHLQKVPLPIQSWFVEALADNQHAVVTDSTTRLFSLSKSQQLPIYLLNENKVENDGEPILVLDSDDFVGSGTGTTPTDYSSSPMWLGSYKNRGWSLRWGQGAIASASLAFNGQAPLTYDGARTEKQQSTWGISPGTRIENAQVELILNSHRPPDAASGSVQLALRERTNGEVVQKTPEVRLQDSRLLQLNWTPRLNHPYNVELTFRDEYGTKSIISWAGVEFRLPLLQRPWVRTTVAFLLLCGLSALTLILQPVSWPVRRWLPLLCAVLGSGTTFFEWAGAYNIDASLLMRLLIGSTLLLTAVGLISPPVYRTLAQIQPFHFITPYFLLLTSVRRRMFMPYVRWSREQLRLVKERANYEVYSAIPATVQEQNERSKRSVIDPATEILKCLTEAHGPRASVLVEAPGGRGKSALLRAVIELSLERFMQDRGAPLPVVCSGDKGSLDEMVKAALGKYAISPEILATQIQAGRFFLLVDGPGESKLTADQINEWVTSERADTAPLLVASRPKDDIRRSIQAAERWALVEPQRLTDETLELFQNNYLANDSKHFESVPTKLTDKVKAVCRGSDGTYLPILVRLAMLVGTHELDGIARLYECTFKRLLREGNAQAAVLDEASSMCVATYWPTGQRTIVFDRAPDPRARLIRRLLEAGVLVPSDLVSRLVGEPREVRFFHDSMQSYLTARGLLNGAEPWPALLSEAAGHPRFKEAERADNLERGSELFRMCLQVFGPQVELKRALKTDLLHWANTYNKKLTRHQVEQAVPFAFVERLNEVVAPELGAGAALIEVVNLFAAEDDAKAVELLGVLYARIAERVWSLKEADELQGFS
jgi:hypothetical protein